MDINREELKERYIKLSTNELLEIIDDKFGYPDLAVKVALAELFRRNQSENDIQNYKVKLVQYFKGCILKIVYYDLKVYQKMLFYIFWMPVLNSAFKMKFQEKIEYLKLKQANYYSLMRFVFFLLLV